jgi:serine/threonine protein kinase
VDPDEELAQTRLGTEVGGFVLERLLGVGGMASVFVGRRPDGLVAAVKLLHASLASYPEVRARFLREGPIGSALAAVGPLCQGLPQVYESGLSSDGTAYLAMELLVGETLYDLLQRVRVLPPGQAVWVALGVLDVLVVAHAHGIVHRDLKPENLVVLPSGVLKVLDFGVARVLEALPDGSVLPEKTRTKTGSIVGSGHYMAPEQAIGRVRDIDGRTDVFGLGATMFRALSGRPLHDGLRDAALVIASATRPPPPLASVAPAVPPHVCAVVDRALAFERAQRYADAATMRADCLALKAGRPPTHALATPRAG